eukprot:snap_masked-scaffold_20-processed-gene-0.40-mRNA-1 protein AED:1.00 eAED:1.00 QI:0/0/0/0/1/1/2/0/121
MERIEDIPEFSLEFILKGSFSLGSFPYRGSIGAGNWLAGSKLCMHREDRSDPVGLSMDIAVDFGLRIPFCNFNFDFQFDHGRVGENMYHGMEKGEVEYTYSASSEGERTKESENSQGIAKG